MSQHRNIADLSHDDDHTLEAVTPGMPVLWPFANPGPAIPPPTATCARCGSSTFWHERSGRVWGVRCIVCVPPPRPDDRIQVIETIREPVAA